MDKLVNINSYGGLADFKWGEKPGTDKDQYMVEVSMIDIPLFFQYCVTDGGDYKFVIVTPPSDHSLCYQADYSINSNMVKFLEYNHDVIMENAAKGNPMDDVIFMSRADSRCNPTHKYAIKIDMYTYATFPLGIPQNVIRWFAPNVNIRDDRVEHLPFGVNSSPETFPESPGKAGMLFDLKSDSLYINFSEHTIDRKRYKEYFRKFHWTHIVDKEPREAGIPVEQYLAHINCAKFVLCPRGLGLDCFRTWETLHYDSIPVLEKEPWNEWMTDLYPVILVDSFYNITSIEYLLLLHEKNQHKTDVFLNGYSNDYLKETYWRNKICQHVVPEQTNQKITMAV